MDLQSHNIAFVSRLDADCSLGARQLCAIAPKIYEKYPDTNIFIVGGGTEYDKISSIANQTNAKLNHKLITMIGKVKNPKDYFQNCALFVGVSRAALEAMSEGLPCILLGNEGFLGLFTENKLGEARESNFTCRNSPKHATKEMLLREICQYFALSQEAKEKISELSRRVVENEYSADSMTEATLGFYSSVVNSYRREHPKKIAICGYYGHSNLGDEAILHAIKKSIRTADENARICIINGKNPIKTAKKMIKSDLFVFGGGSLLQSATSRASLLYYLLIIFAAHLTCERRIMLANGLGAFRGAGFDKIAIPKLLTLAFESFDYVSVRDSHSQKLARKLAKNKKIHLVPDPAWVNFENINQKLNESHSQNNFFAFFPCKRALEREKISPQILATSLENLSKSQKRRCKIIVLNRKEDLPFANEIKKHLPNLEIWEPNDEKELISMLSGARFAISLRYHGALFSLGCNVPTLAVSRDPKMKAFCEDFALEKAKSPVILTNSTVLLREIERTVLPQNDSELPIGNSNVNTKLISASTRTARTAIRAGKKLDSVFKRFL